MVGGGCAEEWSEGGGGGWVLGRGMRMRYSVFGTYAVHGAVRGVGGWLDAEVPGMGWGAETKVRQKWRNTSRVGATGRKGETGQSTLIRRDSRASIRASPVCVHVCACVHTCYASVRSELEIGSTPAGGRLCCPHKVIYFDRN